jgi:hypothetical protein
MTVATNQNVGIGTTSPDYPLTVQSGDAAISFKDTGGTSRAYIGISGVFGSAPTGALRLRSDQGGLVYGYSGTEQMRIDTSGNVGIGTSSLTARLQIKGAVGGATSLKLENSDASRIYGIVNGLNTGTDGIFTIYDYTASAPRLNIDTSGNLLVGTTSTSTVNGGIVFIPSSSGTVGYGRVGHASGAGSGTGYFDFLYNNSIIGSITQNGTTAVAYNTSSDYRLKENVAPMTTGLATIDALKPVTYDWISDKSVGEGFIAHELAEVIPLAVTGEKDAVDDDGKPRHQGVDYSKIVVHLVAAIQELSAKNDALEARLAALEAK